MGLEPMEDGVATQNSLCARGPSASTARSSRRGGEQLWLQTFGLGRWGGGLGVLVVPVPVRPLGVSGIVFRPLWARALQSWHDKPEAPQRR